MIPRPRKINGRFPVDLVISVLILVIAIGFSIWVGLRLSDSQLDKWGQWISASIAALALLGSSYAVVLQARQGESSGWNIALSRLGEIYDQACNNTRLATIINQPSDPNWEIEIDPDDISLPATEDIWLGSLFLAYEQIFVATKGLSEESKRVWRIYLRNQLNKPYIRATFVKDAISAKDYHQDFWRFVRGKKDGSSDYGYSDYVIHPKYFQKTDQVSSIPELTEELSYRPFSKQDACFWLSLYRDNEVKRQMYAAPTNSEEDLSCYLDNREVYTVLLGETPVGGFTITLEKERIGSVGFVIHPEYRGKGLSRKILLLLEKESQKLGLLTLRADVYSDNLPSIRSLESSGFRKFLWLEKNIQ